MLLCIKRHLSNMWNSIYEKVQQNWSCKRVAYKKKRAVWMLGSFLIFLCNMLGLKWHKNLKNDGIQYRFPIW